MRVQYVCEKCGKGFDEEFDAERCESACTDQENSNTFVRFWFDQFCWSVNTFGSSQDRGPNGPLKHLEKEAREASAEDDLTRKRMEIADCLFLVVDAAWRAGMTPGTLLQTAFEKLEINKSRKWGPKTTDGAVEHIREGE